VWPCLVDGMCNWSKKKYWIQRVDTTSDLTMLTAHETPIAENSLSNIKDILKSTKTSIDIEEELIKT